MRRLALPLFAAVAMAATAAVAQDTKKADTPANKDVKKDDAKKAGDVKKADDAKKSDTPKTVLPPAPTTTAKQPDAAVVKELKACAQECFDCMKCCRDMKKPEHDECAKVCETCHNACWLAAHAIEAKMALSRDAVALCEKFCVACAESCERFKNACCEECAKECRKCAKACADALK